MITMQTSVEDLISTPSIIGPCGVRRAGAHRASCSFGGPGVRYALCCLALACPPAARRRHIAPVQPT